MSQEVKLDQRRQHTRPNRETGKRLDGWDARLAEVDRPTNILLDFPITTDVASGSAVPGTTWSDIHSNQSFTKVGADSLLWVVVTAVATNTVAGVVLQSAVVLDSGGPIRVGGGTSNYFGGSGTVIISGVGAGAHVMKTQIWASGAANLFLRATSAEFFNLKVIETG